MKNINTNESTSFESSLGSPTKPLQSYEAQKPKQIFFVNSIEDTPQPLINTIINLGPPPKKQPPNPGKKNEKKKIKFQAALKLPKNKINNKPQHTLNFDALFKNIILQGNKSNKNKRSNNSSNKSRNKLVGNKRIRNTSNKTSANKTTVVKKKKVENKSTTNKSKGKSNINNNSNPSQYSNLYDINNFFSCAVKIREKSITHNVICPSFEELSPDFFEDNKIEDNEDTSDEAYLKYHNIFEQKEIDYRIKVCNNLDKKKSKKELRKEIIETKNAYKNLYSSDNIDNKKDQEGNNNPNENGNSISSGINIIKINLDSLEFELNE
jgi:hypothetical protein